MIRQQRCAWFAGHDRGTLYALLLAPITLLTTRPGTVASIVTVVNVIILAPLATYCLLDVGRRITGRPFAILAAATWLFAPLVAIPLFVPKFHDTYVDDVLPALYGLTIGPAFLAMALSLAAAMLALRAVAGARRAAFAAGLLAAAAITCCPMSAPGLPRASSAPSWPLVVGARPARHSPDWRPAWCRP